MTPPEFTFIIPVKEINEYIRETVDHILRLHYQSWELIILPNNASNDEWGDSRIRIISSGRVGPAKKRDMGASLAKSPILVFLDDDSYPDVRLLDVARRLFKDESIVALGGPGITPETNNFWQKVSGAVFLSKFSGGAPERYIPIGSVHEVDDWPSVNLMVRTNNFLQAGGFDCEYWPGEDTKLCLNLITKTNKKIIYSPDLKVWHHRREGLASHLKQIGAYGLHRGYFARVYPQNSRRIKYFAPSFLVLYLICTCVSGVWFREYLKRMLLGWTFYGGVLVLAYFDMTKYVAKKIALIAIIYTVITHFWYGVRFIQGFGTKRLISQLR